MHIDMIFNNEPHSVQFSYNPFSTMASLESKLLDGRNVGYCSSSDEEDGDWQVANDEDEHQSNVMRRLGPSSNTGAKGVLREFAAQKEAANRNKQAKLRELSELSKKGMLEMSKEEREQVGFLHNHAQAEDSLENLRQRRLMELRKAAAGKIVEIMDKDQFTKAIDTCENMLCVLLYEPEDEMCQKMTHICKLLAADFPRVKFVRAKSTLLRMSKAF
ncbi:unnamed protein product, partial [Cylicostephanus goldi]